MKVLEIITCPNCGLMYNLNKIVRRKDITAEAYIDGVGWHEESIYTKLEFRCFCNTIIDALDNKTKVLEDN